MLEVVGGVLERRFEGLRGEGVKGKRVVVKQNEGRRKKSATGNYNTSSILGFFLVSLSSCCRQSIGSG